MNKKIFIVSIIVMMIFIPIKIYADTCSADIQNEYYNKINNIKYSIDYVENNDYNITFYNIPENIQIYNDYGILVNKNSESEITSSSYEGGKNYTFNFYIQNLSCDMSIKFQKNIYITKYNLYSEREECKLEENADFKLCKPEYQGTITDESFERELNKYTDELNKDVEEEPVEVSENNNNNYYLYYIIGGISLILIIMVIIIISKSRKKAKRLI